MRRMGPAALLTALLAAGCGDDDETVEIPSAALKLAVVDRLAKRARAESVPHEWLRLSVYPRKPSVFAVERVPF